MEEERAAAQEQAEEKQAEVAISEDVSDVFAVSLK